MHVSVTIHSLITLSCHYHVGIIIYHQCSDNDHTSIDNHWVIVSSHWTNIINHNSLIITIIRRYDQWYYSVYIHTNICIYIYILIYIYVIYIYMYISYYTLLTYSNITLLTFILTLLYICYFHVLTSYNEIWWIPTTSPWQISSIAPSPRLRWVQWDATQSSGARWPGDPSPGSVERGLVMAKWQWNGAVTNS